MKVTTDVLPDDAASVLLNEAHTAAALVVGSRGRSGLAELLLGSVSLTVAGRAACPVVVLRGDQDNRAGARTHRRVVLGVGEDRTARRPPGSPSRRPRSARPPWTPYGPGAARRTSADDPLLEGEPARLHEQRAAEIMESALSKAAAAHPAVDLHRRTAEGSARRILLAASDDADLLVVGVRRHHGLAGLQLGRVAHTLLHHSACPVAVVPQRG